MNFFIVKYFTGFLDFTGFHLNNVRKEQKWESFGLSIDLNVLIVYRQKP